MTIGDNAELAPAQARWRLGPHPRILLEWRRYWKLKMREASRRLASGQPALQAPGLRLGAPPCSAQALAPVRECPQLASTTPMTPRPVPRFPHQETPPACTPQTAQSLRALSSAGGYGPNVPRPRPPPAPVRHASEAAHPSAPSHKLLPAACDAEWSTLGWKRGDGSRCAG